MCSTLTVQSNVIVGERAVHRGDDAARVVGSVQEIRIAKRDVPRPGVDLLGDVGQHHVDIDDTNASVVDNRHRAVAASVHAPAARLDIADEPLFAASLESTVAIESGQGDAPRHRSARRDRLAAVDPLGERCDVLAREQCVGDALTHRRVQPVEGDPKIWAPGLQRPGRGHRQARGRVHRHRERDRVDIVGEGRIPRVHRYVEQADVVAPVAESRRRGRRRAGAGGRVRRLTRAGRARCAQAK